MGVRMMEGRREFHFTNNWSLKILPSAAGDVPPPSIFWAASRFLSLLPSANEQS